MSKSYNIFENKKGLNSIVVKIIITILAGGLFLMGVVAMIKKFT